MILVPTLATTKEVCYDGAHPPFPGGSGFRCGNVHQCRRQCGIMDTPHNQTNSSGSVGKPVCYICGRTSRTDPGWPHCSHCCRSSSVLRRALVHQTVAIVVVKNHYQLRKEPKRRGSVFFVFLSSLEN